MIGNTIAESKWELARLGKLTSSEIHKIFTASGKITDGMETYLFTKAAEILTGQIRVMDGIYALQWGIDKEPEAIEKLIAKYPDLIYYGNEDKKFFPYTDLSGGTPDFVEAELKIVGEIKCPESTATHVEYLLLKDGDALKACKKEYWYQIHMNMACVAKEIGCKYSDMKGMFVSYSPCPIEDKHQLKIIHLEPDPAFELTLKVALEKAEKFMRDLMIKLG